MTESLPRRIAWFSPWTWKRRWLWVAVAALVFISYPLSYGPVFALCAGGWLPWSIYTTGYLPIFWLEGQHQSVDDLFDWYEGICYEGFCYLVTR